MNHQIMGASRNCFITIISNTIIGLFTITNTLTQLNGFTMFISPTMWDHQTIDKLVGKTPITMDYACLYNYTVVLLGFINQQKSLGWPTLYIVWYIFGLLYYLCRTIKLIYYGY